MDRVITTTELASLLARIPYQEELTSEDIQLIDLSTQKAASGADLSSQMANIHNQIWMRLYHLDQKNYWTVIGSLMAGSVSNQTKSLALFSMAKQIAANGQTFREELKSQLIQFISRTQQQVLSCPSALHLKPMVQQILVSFLKVYWRQGFLQQFIEKINEDLAEMSINKLLFYLQTIKRVIREGFEIWSDQYTSSESYQFQECLAQQMRNIIKIVCFCLSDSPEIENTIPPGLNFVKEVATVVPAFELFNSQLIEVLLQLLGQNRYEEEALDSLKEIFAFKESDQKKDHHHKIAKKMFSVLEVLLKRYVEGIDQNEERQRLRSSINFDKQSGSTKDSFFSKTTLGKRQQKSALASKELLHLLYSYLIRYVPFMNAAGSEDDLEIESQHTIKLYFSKELYDYFGQHFWKFIKFLVSVGKHLDINLVQKPQKEVQMENIYAICIKLMLQLFFKLKLPQDSALGQLVEIIILKITPLQKVFKNIYGCLQLIQDKNRRYVQQQLRDISDQYFQIHYQILKKLQSDKITVKAYRETILMLMDKYIEENTELENIDYTSEIVNAINRISWSIVASEDVGTSIVFEESLLNRFVGSYISIINRVNFSSTIKRAVASNLKYILQIGIFKQYPEILFSTLANQDNEIYIEYTLLILSKIFLRPNFNFQKLGYSEQKIVERIGILVASINDITERGYYSQTFSQIYSGVLRLIGKMIECYIPSKGKLDFMKDFFINVQEILIFQKIEKLYQNLNQINIMTTSFVMKLNQICTFIEVMNDHLITNYQNESQRRGCTWIMRKHSQRLEKVFIEYLEYSYKLYSDEVAAFRIQNFEMQKINEYRERYHTLLVQQMKMVKILHLKDSSNENAQKIIKDKIVIFKNAEGRLLEDFQFQTQFKCINFFTFTQEFLRFMADFKEPNCKELINQKVMLVMEILEHEKVKENEKFIFEKTSFLKEIIKYFFQDLQPPTIEILDKLFCSFYDRTMAVKDNLLETVELFFQQIEKMTKEAPSWQCTISLIKKTFEHLLMFNQKYQELFRRISHLFYYQLLVLSHSEFSIGKDHTSYSNAEIVQVVLKQHLYSNVRNRLPQEFQEHLSSLLQNIFSEKNESKFYIKIKDYRVYLLRWLKPPEEEILSM